MNTKINIKRVNDDVHLRAYNKAGNVVSIDGSPDIGGQELGARPMELLLMALGGCSSMDVISILKKMRQELIDFDVEVEGTREEGAIPAVYTNINLHFKLSGNIKPEKAEKAIKMSVEKFCSVSKMIDKTAEVTWSYTIN